MLFWMCCYEYDSLFTTFRSLFFRRGVVLFLPAPASCRGAVDDFLLVGRNLGPASEAVEAQFAARFFCKALGVGEPEVTRCAFLPLAFAVEALAVAVEGFPVFVEGLTLAVEGFSLPVEGFSVTAEGLVLAVAALVAAVERFAVALVGGFAPLGGHIKKQSSVQKE